MDRWTCVSSHILKHLPSLRVNPYDKYDTSYYTTSSLCELQHQITCERDKILGTGDIPQEWISFYNVDAYIKVTNLFTACSPLVHQIVASVSQRRLCSVLGMVSLTFTLRCPHRYQAILFVPLNTSTALRQFTLWYVVSINNYRFPCDQYS